MKVVTYQGPVALDVEIDGESLTLVPWRPNHFSDALAEKLGSTYAVSVHSIPEPQAPAPAPEPVQVAEAATPVTQSPEPGKKQRLKARE